MRRDGGLGTTERDQGYEKVGVANVQPALAASFLK